MPGEQEFQLEVDRLEAWLVLRPVSGSAMRLVNEGNYTRVTLPEGKACLALKIKPVLEPARRTYRNSERASGLFPAALSAGGSWLDNHTIRNGRSYQPVTRGADQRDVVSGLPPAPGDGFGIDGEDLVAGIGADQQPVQAGIVAQVIDVTEGEAFKPLPTPAQIGRKEDAFARSHPQRTFRGEGYAVDAGDHARKTYGRPGSAVGGVDQSARTRRGHHAAVNGNGVIIARAHHRASL